MSAASQKAPENNDPERDAVRTGQSSTELDLSNIDDPEAIAVGLVRPASTVAVVGVGDGKLPEALVRLGCQVWGIKTDKELSEPPPGTYRDLLFADPSDLDLATGFSGLRFDVVVVVNTLGYVRDPVAFLAGCGDVLSEDGYVVVSVPNVAYAGVQMDLLEGRLPYGQCGGRELPARFFDRASLLTTVERAGLCRLSETTTLGHPLNASSSRPPSVLGARVAAALADHPESSVEHFVLTLARPGCKLSEPPPMLPLAHLHARFRALRQDQERIAAWADGEVSTIREESAERERSFKEMAAKLSGLESRLAQVAAQFELELQARLASAFEETESVRKDLDALRNELSAVYATKTFRYTTSLRKLYAALRSHGSSR